MLRSFCSSGKQRLIVSGSEPALAAYAAQLHTLSAQLPPGTLHVRPGAACPGEKEADAFHVHLDAPFGRCGLVIMASGMGRRFGGNKLMAPFGGRPMIAHILDATDGLFARRVVVTRHETVAALCRAQGIDCLLHDLPLRSDTVRLGIAQMEDLHACMFCPADQPLLTRDTVSALALCAAHDPASIWRAAWQQTPGLPAVFPRWAFCALASLPAGAGGGYLMRQHASLVRTVQASSAQELADADDPPSLAALEALYRAQR